jgi:hypothetical protein
MMQQGNLSWIVRIVVFLIVAVVVASVVVGVLVGARHDDIIIRMLAPDVITQRVELDMKQAQLDEQASQLAEQEKATEALRSEVTQREADVIVREGELMQWQNDLAQREYTLEQNEAAAMHRDAELAAFATELDQKAQSLNAQETELAQLELASSEQKAPQSQDLIVPNQQMDDTTKAGFAALSAALLGGCFYIFNLRKDQRKNKAARCEAQRDLKRVKHDAARVQDLYAKRLYERSCEIKALRLKKADLQKKVDALQTQLAQCKCNIAVNKSGAYVEKLMQTYEDHEHPIFH